MEITFLEGLEPVIEAIHGSLNSLILVAAILFLTYLAAKIAKRVLEESFIKSTDLVKVDPTRYNFVKHLTSAIIYLCGLGIAVYTIPELRALSISIFAGAGVLAVIIGFASQQAFSNVISGLFITIFQPYRVGDRISLKETIYGVVEDITLRHTIIRTFENKRVIIPNAIIGNEIIENSHLGDEKICKFIEFGISYDSDIDQAMEIMRDESMKHPEFLDNRSPAEKRGGKPAVDVKLISFGDSSVNLRAYVWARNPAAAFRLGCDLNKSIKQRFDREAIEIPYPYRTVVFKNNPPTKDEKS